MNECHCDCHNNPEASHVAPCCEPCGFCSRNIVMGGMDEHLAEDHGDPVATDKHRTLEPLPENRSPSGNMRAIDGMAAITAYNDARDEEPDHT